MYIFDTSKQLNELNPPVMGKLVGNEENIYTDLLNFIDAWNAFESFDDDINFRFHFCSASILLLSAQLIRNNFYKIYINLSIALSLSTTESKILRSLHSALSLSFFYSSKIQILLQYRLGLICKDVVGFSEFRGFITKTAERTARCYRRRGGGE